MINMQAIRVGFFNSGQFTPTPGPGPTYWAGVWLKPEAGHWQAVWTQVGTSDPWGLVAPGIGLGRQLAKTLGLPLELPEIES